MFFLVVFFELEFTHFVAIAYLLIVIDLRTAVSVWPLSVCQYIHAMQSLCSVCAGAGLYAAFGYTRFPDFATTNSGPAFSMHASTDVSTKVTCQSVHLVWSLSYTLSLDACMLRTKILMNA